LLTPHWFLSFLGFVFRIEWTGEEGDTRGDGVEARSDFKAEGMPIESFVGEGYFLSEVFNEFRGIVSWYLLKEMRP
jgi:hypothetical protein